MPSAAAKNKPNHGLFFIPFLLVDRIAPLSKCRIRTLGNARTSPLPRSAGSRLATVDPPLGRRRSHRRTSPRPPFE
jgi:hypothetical protein